LEDWRARFGIYFLTVLLGGTLGIVTTTTILISYWTWGNGDVHDGIWAYVVNANWGTRLITLCSTVLQVCVSAQSVLCCMLLATLSLEHGHVLFKDAPAMSMYQYAVPGPYNMTLPLFRGAIHNKQLHYSKKPLGFICLVGLAVVTTVNQFTSTLLVSDTTDWSLSGVSEVRQVFFASSKGFLDSQDTLSLRPSKFPTFAEGSRNGSAFKILDAAGNRDWKDTGSYTRAMIPLPRTERETLIEYHDPAALMDAHVLCVAYGPENISADIEYRYYKPGNTTGTSFGGLVTSSLDNIPNSNKVQDIISFSMKFANPINIPLSIIYSERQRSRNSSQINPALEGH